VFLLLLLAPFAAHAQVDPQGVRRDPTRPLTDGERQKKLDRDLESREHDMRMLEAGRIEVAPTELSPAVKLRMLIAEIQKDADQLQSNNSKLQESMKTTTVPDYKRIAGYASEMRKAVLRLQTNLAIPKPETQEEKAEIVSGLPTEQLKSSVLALERLVSEFVASEVLQRPIAVDAQLFTKAGQDLRGMLRHTTKVKKLADELREK
jgi:hypothetical protein